MPNTPGRNYPYPELGATPNGPAQIQALALALDVDVSNLDGQVSTLQGEVDPDRSDELVVAPEDGQRMLYAVDDGILWEFRYNDALGLWEFIGGPALAAIKEGVGTRGAASYNDLTGADVGPEITIPLSGVYDVTIHARVQSGSAGNNAFASYAIGGTAADDDDGISSDAVNSTVGCWTRRKTLAAGDLLRMKYKGTSSGTTTVSKRRIAAIPVNVDN